MHINITSRGFSASEQCGTWLVGCHQCIYPLSIVNFRVSIDVAEWGLSSTEQLVRFYLLTTHSHSHLITLYTQTQTP